MGDAFPPERRDIASTLADLRVGVAEIKTTQQLQTKTLERMEDRLNIAILRDEFNGRNTTVDKRLTDIDKALKTIEDDSQRKKGRDDTWRLVFSGALAILTVLIAIVSALKL